MGQDETSFITKKWKKRFWYTVAVSAVVFTFYWFLYLKNIAYTNDAYVHGNMIIVTPLQGGIITDIYTDDTFLVEKGELIVQFDETDARIALNRAQDELGKAVRNVCQKYHRTFALQSTIDALLADLIVAKQDWDHRIDVIDEGGVSLENFQHAVAALRSSYFRLKAAQSNYLREKAAIQAVSIRNNPIVKAAAERLTKAFVALFRCRIYAPNKGLVAQRTAQVGMYTPAGEPLMSVIPLDQIWVNANYKETQMNKMRIGQDVRVTADMYGEDVVYHGKIVGLPGGAGNAFSLLPPQNLSGNWIKIVQRLPVRIIFPPEELIEHPLRIGMTMKATTRIDQKGPLVPTSTKGSPHYMTNVLEIEELGSQALIDTIIALNIDSSLKEYEKKPFEANDNELLGRIDKMLEEESKFGEQDF